MCQYKTHHKQGLGATLLQTATKLYKYRDTHWFFRIDRTPIRDMNATRHWIYKGFKMVRNWGTRVSGYFHNITLTVHSSFLGLNDNSPSHELENRTNFRAFANFLWNTNLWDVFSNYEWKLYVFQILCSTYEMQTQSVGWLMNTSTFEKVIKRW